VSPECAFHPGVETNVRCANCDRYICSRDMVETPVGIKCRECALPPAAARRRGKPEQYIGAVLAAFGAAVLGGLLMRQLFGAVPFIGILSWWIALALGAGIAEATRLGARGNRGPAFAAIAGAAAFVCAFLAGVGIIGWVFAVVAAVTSALAGRW